MTKPIGDFSARKEEILKILERTDPRAVYSGYVPLTKELKDDVVKVFEDFLQKNSATRVRSDYKRVGFLSRGHYLRIRCGSAAVLPSTNLRTMRERVLEERIEKQEDLKNWTGLFPPERLKEFLAGLTAVIPRSRYQGTDHPVERGSLEKMRISFLLNPDPKN